MTINNLLENERLKKLRELVSIVENEKKSPFYRDKFQTAGVDLSILKTLDDLVKFPLVQWIDFLETSFWKRFYKRKALERKIVKVISEYEKPFLVQRNFDDLREEEYCLLGLKRPQVVINNIHEALEKSFLFYELDVLPLIGEPNNLAITAFNAKERNIDSIVINEQLFVSYINLLKDSMDMAPLKIIIIGQFANPKQILQTISNTKFSQVRLILELPETGPFAYACPEALAQGKLVFHPDRNSIVENEGALIITKTIHMPTPIIRYQTDIFAQPEKKDCHCKTEQSFRLI